MYIRSFATVTYNALNGAPSNVRLPEGMAITVMSDVYYPSCIGVTAAAPGTSPALTDGLFGHEYSGSIYSDDAQYCVWLNDDDEYALRPASAGDHTVTYMVDGEIFLVALVEDGGRAPCPTPAKKNYRFDCWRDEYEDEFDAYAPIYDDAVFHAT